MFDAIAEPYCRKDLLPASRVARRQRLNQTIAALDVGEGFDLLEVGCGAGFAASYLAGRYGSYCGIDASAELVERAKVHNARAGATFLVTEVEDFDPPGRYDVVLAIGVLHHLREVCSAVGRMADWLRPGGWLVVNEPQPGNPLVRLARWVRKRVDPGYSRQQRQLSMRELLGVFRSAGLTGVRLVPQGLFSTPFAEVRLPFQPVAHVLAKAACRIDSTVEARARPGLCFASWNLICAGRKP